MVGIDVVLDLRNKSRTRRPILPIEGGRSLHGLRYLSSEAYGARTRTCNFDNHRIWVIDHVIHGFLHRQNLLALLCHLSEDRFYEILVLIHNRRNRSVAVSSDIMSDGLRTGRSRGMNRKRDIEGIKSIEEKVSFDRTSIGLSNFDGSPIKSRS